MDTRIIIVTSAALFALFVISFLFRFILLYQKKTTAFAAEKKVMEAYFQQELLTAQLEIQEQTLKNISQEIHDNIGQTLSLAKLNLNTIVGDNAHTKINNSKELLTKAIADLRALSRTLHSDTITSAGLMAALQFELDQLQRSGGYTAHLDVEGEVRSLPPQHELFLFRIVQEALNNMIKHAEATVVTIKAVFSARHVELRVQDNGKGFVLPQTEGSMRTGIGLQSMHNRVTMLQGELRIDSEPQKGTTIWIKIPA